ncbi:MULTISPECIES: glycosyl hydrolase-related protein [unclassified Oceanispirochaeta]|uniref:glycoside hydrolase family 38 N-terminal domain-containing protein n=1 Tax=unclassified Oceanispirochaeta TaxID=2635722 RepID=UPI000E09027B|nr:MULTISPECIES: glycosyl hydrolase-related protein [unclassified Oceanispirochaeta]MBF9015958.1 hypothetical protein [Oceanispirochaeta sp. M2]NPD72421.1 hypothetical protein [Oceanispirochaeta sp. M1]RDG32189.1 hypothetical protein DV872_09935 [Oceanispirochaeta sp. M1]
MKIKEILVLHHSHMDIGYTHSQPVLWNLQREFIDQVLDMLEETSQWPKLSQPKWTIEVTAQILHWLKTADEKSIETLKAYVAQERIGLSGLQFNTTPLCNLEQLISQLRPIRGIEQALDYSIKTVIQHDVNGIAWPIVDLLHDNGIKALIMGINPHLGRAAASRPSFFHWEGPSKKKILVVNGEHYTMFDQQLKTAENSIETMKTGLDRYLTHLEGINYQQDFLYLTSSNVPVCWDNSPPNMQVARLIREWNDNDCGPVIRYVTPNELLKRVQQIPESELCTMKGDWTDFWNFGSASSAYETALNQKTKSMLFSAELIGANKIDPKPAIRENLDQSWKSLNIYDEHTWGCDESMDVDSYNTRSQWSFKAIKAYEAREHAFYPLIASLEDISENPGQAEGLEGVLLCNLTSKEQNVPVMLSKKWQTEGKQLRTARFRNDMQLINTKEEELIEFASVSIPAFGWRRIPLDQLEEPVQDSRISHGKYVKKSTQAIISFDTIRRIDDYIEYIESPFHRIEFDPKSGRILSLFDKRLAREILDIQNDWTFFQMVREYPDPLIDGRRESYYDRDIVKLLDDESCWSSSWACRREGAESFVSYEIEQKSTKITLVLRFKMDGMTNMEQRIVLHPHIPDIDLSVSFNKEECTDPESYYLVFPLALKSGWKGIFNTADTQVSLDDEQLPGACRDWVTAQSFVAMQDDDIAVSLCTPDAPMAMFGDFNFSKESTVIPRDKNPLLLSWPLNNYWNTNFRASQAGFIQLNYSLIIENSEEEYNYAKRAERSSVPLLSHPLINCSKAESGVFFTVTDSENIQVSSVTAMPENGGYRFRLINTSSETSEPTLTIPDFTVGSAYSANIFDERITDIPFTNNEVHTTIAPKEIQTICIKRKKG